MLGSVVKSVRKSGCEFALKRLQYNVKNVGAAFYGTHTDTHGVKSKDALAYENDLKVAADHIGRQQNHIWNKDEIAVKFANLTHHEPTTITDKVVNKIMFGLYHSFNFVTGFKPVNTSVKAMEWRLIVLESVAGVPGFVAAGVRHFRSLRRLQRDHGWIATCLEEAENERMHLFVCLRMFNATRATRFLVLAAQVVLSPLLFVTYIVHPPAMHRFVGYLEETACMTYANIITQCETPGTPLHEAWSKLDAPDVAKAYWKLPHDATFIDTLKCMFADETVHRDVNHTFAEMGQDDPNPFVSLHRENAIRALMLETTGQTAWPAKMTEAGLDVTSIAESIQHPNVVATSATTTAAAGVEKK